jgi:predicted O-methyltransferase YrrM
MQHTRDPRRHSGAFLQGFPFDPAPQPRCEYSRAGAKLAELHGEGRGWSGCCKSARRLWRRLLRGSAADATDCGIGADCGVLLYQFARLADARLIVSLGAADAAAAIWLACALRANSRHPGDRGLIVCEPEPALAQRTRSRLRQAGVSRYVDLREDAPLQALRRVDQPVDGLLLCAYPQLMLPVLEALLPRLRPGAMVIALRPGGEPRAWANYLRRVRDPTAGFSSATLPCQRSVELSVRNP